MNDPFEHWASGPRTEAAALDLLEPFALDGLVAASDAAGLTLRSRDFPLPVVLHDLHEPKARLFRYVSGLGARPIGRWFADNTTTFFPTEHAVDVVRALVACHADHGMRIGIAIHRGRFWSVDDSLYGPDATLVLDLAEHYCRGGETRLTPQLAAELAGSATLHLSPPESTPLGPTHRAELIGAAPLPHGHEAYPLPYGDEAHQDVLRVGQDPSRAESFQARWAAHRTVLVAMVASPAPTTLAATIDQIITHRRFHALARPLLGAEQKRWRDIVLASFVSQADALDAATGLRRACTDAGISVCVGLDAGTTYRFPLDDGTTEFAGDPVNRASKLAEDLADPRGIVMTTRAADSLHLSALPSRKWSVSGVEIEVHLLSDAGDR